MAYGLNLRTPYTAHSLVVNMVGSGQDVLEIGCASGYLLKEFHKKGCRVTGIDRDTSALQAAAAPDFQLIEGDIQSPATWDTLKGKQFDTVVMADVLEHLAAPGDVLLRVKTILKPSGNAIVSVPNVVNWKIRAQLMW